MSTLSELTSEINTRINTNSLGEVTAEDLRTVLIDMSAKILADVALVADEVTSGSITQGDQVLMIFGDSTVASSLPSSDQTAAAAAYTPSPYIHVMDQDGAFVQYTPGTMAGLDHLTNSPAIGPDYAFVAKWRARFPTTNLYICKCAASGACQARGNPWGSLTLSASGGVFTQTGGASTVNHGVIVGAGIPTGTYCIDNVNNLLGTIGTAGQNHGITFSSITASEMLGLSSFSPTEGCLYSGYAGSITNGARGLVNTALATLNNPRIRTLIYSMGTNDIATSVSDAETLFPRDMTAFLSTFDADFPVPNSVIKRFLMRPSVTFSNAQVTAVRNAVANEAATRSNTYMIDMDSYAHWDGVHWEIAGVNAAANFAFDQTFP